MTSVRGFAYGATSPDGSVTTVNGLFPGTNRAEGAVGFTNYPVCGTILGTPWTASKR